MGSEPMNRSRPDVRLIKQNRSYSIPELASLFGVRVETVRRWVRQGLPAIDDQRPKLIHGAQLREWLIAKRSKRRMKCGPRQMYCCKCRDAREMMPGSAVVTFRNEKSASIKAHCIVCGTSMFRQSSKTDAAHWIDMGGPEKGRKPSLVASSNPLTNDHFSRSTNSNSG